MPKVNKQLSYKKCRRCRHDKAKCLPEARAWPGRRCDRCQRFDYECSASSTKTEEVSDAQHGSASETISDIPEPPKKTTSQYLQDFDDLQRLKKISNQYFFHEICILETTIKEIDDQFKDVKEILLDQAAQYKTDGFLKEAESLLSHLLCKSTLKPEALEEIQDLMDSHPENTTINHAGLLVSLSHESGKHWTAIELQEQIVEKFYLAADDDCFDNVMSSLFEKYESFAARARTISIKSAGLDSLAHLVVIRRVIKMDIKIITREVIRRFVKDSVLGERSVLNWMLHLAAEHDKENSIHEIMKTALAEIDKISADGVTALHRAVLWRSRGAVHALVIGSFDINIRDLYGRTPLHLACLRSDPEHLELARDLLDHGADVDARDNLEETALFKAVRYANLNVVKLLLKAGADKDLKNHSNESPYSLADKKFKFGIEREIFQLLNSS